MPEPFQCFPARCSAPFCQVELAEIEKTIELVADEIEVDRRTSEATARGGVVLEDPGARIRAEKAVLSLREEIGVLDDVEIYLPTTRFQMRGSWMAKGFGQIV